MFYDCKFYQNNQVIVKPVSFIKNVYETFTKYRSGLDRVCENLTRKLWKIVKNCGQL